MPKNRLEDLNFSDIHQQILTSNSLTQAAKCLDCTSQTLAIYLGKFLHEGAPLNYERLKTISAGVIRDTHSDYDKPWKAVAVSLEQRNFSYIHQQILESRSLKDAGNRLTIKSQTLTSYLGKFLHEGAPLNYERLKRISMEEMRAKYSEYDKPWKAVAVSLGQYNFSHIHQQILASNSLAEAAGNLGVSPHTLIVYLSKFLHEGAPLNYERLRGISEEEMRTTYSEYDKPWQAVAASLEQRNFSHIHQQILVSHSVTEAAGNLGITPQTLNTYLGKFLHEGAPLNYERLQRISMEKMREIYSEYDNPWKTVAASLEQYNFSYIHQQILVSHNLAQAASSLGVSAQTLNVYLGKFLHEGAPLNYERLRSISIEEMRAIHSGYDKPCKAVAVSLEQRHFSHIHQNILASDNLAYAAYSLGVDSRALTTYLGKFLHGGMPLNYERLKHISMKEMRETYSEYDKPWKAIAVPLAQRNFSYIHQQILVSRTLAEAAGNLGITPGTLTTYLGKFSHNGLPLNYRRLKDITVETMRSIYGDQYEKNWTRNRPALPVMQGEMSDSGPEELPNGLISAMDGIEEWDEQGSLGLLLDSLGMFASQAPSYQQGKKRDNPHDMEDRQESANKLPAF